jgi:hypothetical protein
MRAELILALLMAASPAAGQTGTMTPPPRVGGWTEVERPTDDHDIRAAALALVRHLPVRQVGLRRIESASRQVVAGTKYRLTVLLTNRRIWSGTVWHKLDGTYVVSHAARVE